MSILWGGGEDIDFPNGNVVITVSTDTGYFRTGYARCALRGQGFDFMKSIPFPGGGVTECWLSCRYYYTRGWFAGGWRLVGFGSSDLDFEGIYLDTLKDGNQTLALAKWDGSTRTELAYDSANYLISSALNQIVIHFTTSKVDVYINGNLAIEYSGDARPAGLTTIDSILAQTYYANPASAISEVIVTDTVNPSALSLVTHYPTADGDLNEWAASPPTTAYDKIDEPAVSDVDLISTDVADENVQCALSNLPSGAFSVKAIIVVARAQKSDDASIGTLKLGVKSGGTIDVDAGHALSTSWESHERITATINGSAITPTLVDALQIDMKSAA
jgi:hypothetical protein